MSSFFVNIGSKHTPNYSYQTQEDPTAGLFLVSRHLSRASSLLMLKVTPSSLGLHYISSIDKYSSLSEGGCAAPLGWTEGADDDG
jgi:hypothetical protein